MAEITGIEAKDGIAERYPYAYTRKEEPLLGVKLLLSEAAFCLGYCQGCFMKRK